MTNVVNKNNLAFGKARHKNEKYATGFLQMHLALAGLLRSRSGRSHVMLPAPTRLLHTVNASFHILNRPWIPCDAYTK